MIPSTPSGAIDWRRLAGPLATLAAALALTLFLAHGAAAQNQAKDRARFEQVAGQAGTRFQQIIDSNLLLLDGLRGLANARFAVNRAQFYAYVDPLLLPEKHPGVQGLGFAWHMPPDLKARSKERTAELGLTSFHIWPDSGQSDACPIIYLAPAEKSNDAQIGEDLYADPVRRAALLRTVETGQPTVSSKFALPDESPERKQDGLLLVAPMYQTSDTPATLEGRLQRILGFVFCQFRYRDLFQALAAAQPAPEIGFRIFDQSAPAADHLLYQSSPGADSPAAASRPAMVFPLVMADQSWTVQFFERTPFLKESGRTFSPPVTVVGTIISLLLFGIALTRARTRTVELAREAENRIAETRFRRLLEQSLVGIYVIQSERFTYVNPKLAEIFGSTIEEMIGQPVIDFVAEESRPLFRENIARRLSGAVETVHYTLRGQRKDGTIIDVEVYGGRAEYGGQPAVLGSLTEITERKRHEERAAWLASFPERNPNPIIELALADGKIHYVNPSTLSLFPSLVEEGLQHPFLSGLREETKELVAGEKNLVHREIVVGDACYSQTINYLPDIQRLRVYSSEVTAAKRALEALEQSERRLHMVMDLVPHFIFAKDEEGRFLFVNRAFADNYGLPPEQLAGRLDREMLADRAQYEDFRRDDLEVIESGKPKHIAAETRTDPAGRRRIMQVTKIPLPNPGSDRRALLGVAVDITDQKLAEGKIRAQLTRLELLHQITRATGERQDLASIFQVVTRNLEDHLPVDFGCICQYDPATEALTVMGLGTRSEALAGELSLTLQSRLPLDQSALERCIQGRLVHEPDTTRVDFPFPQRLARSSLRSLVLAPLLAESQIFGVLIVARREPEAFSSGECEFLQQLSEHVALSANQAQLYNALQQAFLDLRKTQQAVMQQERLRALGQMASGVAHDINNAISPVSLYTESLLENEPSLSDRARSYLGTIQRAIDDVAATVARMREFYRPREAQLALADVSLNQMATQVLELTRARWKDQAEASGISIVVQTDLTPRLPSIQGAESEIRDALTNLILNAVDAMPDGGSLTLRTRVSAHSPAGKPPRICLEVIDTGLGMDNTTRQRCLELFFTTKGERGTGLGLAMVYGMTQRHGAEMEIESTPGKGTTIRLLFPASVPAAPVAAGSGAPTLATPGSIPRLRLLIIDDDPLVIQSLRTVLESDGHVVTAADGGQAGIDAFLEAQQRGEVFSLVITDLGMPQVDGREVAAALKRAAPALPIVLLTGWGRRLIAENDIPPNVDQILSKPPKLRELRETLARLCSVSHVTPPLTDR